MTIEPPIEKPHHDSIFWVEVERIKPNPYQPRREFDEGALKELSESIRQYGVLQPLTVTRREIPREDGGLMVEYELIAGERRLRASRLASLSMVPVIIRTETHTDQEKLELAIIENVQREDLNPLDRARAFDQLAREFNFTMADIGRKIGKSREYVANSVRLLGLPDHIQNELVAGRLTEGHSRTLLMLNDRPEEQVVLMKEIMLKRLTVREAELIARRIAHDKIRKKGTVNPEIIELEKEFSSKLGTRVTIEPSSVGGKLVISYFSPDDLKSILEMIQLTATEDALSFLAGASVSQKDAADINAVVEAAAVENPELMDDRPQVERDYSSAEDADLYTIRNFTL